MNNCFRDSPYQDARPADTAIKLLVLHNISLPPKSYSGPWVDDLFMGRLDCEAHPYFSHLRGLKVSSHTLIRRNGEIVQYVPFDKRAWHAGKSSWKGQKDCNDYSIGIEIEGSDDESYSQIQYDVLASLIKILIMRYPLLTKDTICGHSDIAPGRKTDPGVAFDWQHLYELLNTKA